MKKRTIGTAASFAILSGMVAVAACGGSNKNAKAPTVPADARAGQVLQNNQGQQVTVVAPPGVNVDLPADAKAAYNKGVEDYSAGDLVAARGDFQDAASKSPKSGVPDYALGAVLERMGDLDGAQAAYQSAFKKDDKFEDAAGAYAVAMANAGKADQAEAFLTYQHGQRADSFIITTYLAEVKSIAGKHSEAQQLAQEALKRNADYTPAMMVIARDYYRAQSYDVATYALNAILDGSKSKDESGKEVVEIAPRAPDSIEAKFLRGLIARQQGARDSAIKDLTDVNAKRRDIVEADIALGEMELEASNAQAAKKPLEDAAQYRPKSAIVHNDLGDCYRVLGMSTEAKREFDTALSLDARMGVVHYNLGLLYLYGKSVPGTNGDEDSLKKSIDEFEQYKQMRTGTPGHPQKDDADDLESTAKKRLDEIQQAKAAAAPPPPAPAGDGGT